MFLPTLDYHISSQQERLKIVEDILNNVPINDLTQTQLNTLSDYIIEGADKQERKKKKILTENRMVTINKRETSFEGLTEKLENGEDGIYSMVNLNKNILLTPKISITKQDLEEIPELRDLYKQIKRLEQILPTTYGRTYYMLKKQLIELHKDQYIIKQAFRKPIVAQKASKQEYAVQFDDNIWINKENGEVESNSLINLYNPKHIAAILANYSSLKEDAYGKFEDDMIYILEELEENAENALSQNFPMLYDILILKVDGISNADIRQTLLEKYGTTYSPEYISNLWKNKIPKLIAQKAKERYLLWYYTNVEKGHWKKCNKCGQIKLAHNFFFSKNKSSRDGYYSICKECRNKKTK